jgi:small GTP-binding protein
MPANLTPDYMAAEQEFKSARTDEERVAALEKMLSTIPKHKGTEKLQSDIKRKLAKMRELEETRASKGGGKPRVSYSIPREGAGQVIVIGAANSGKSSVLGRFTKAHVEIAEYPFTTRKLQPGMMAFENVQVQLVDTPAFSPESFEPWMTSVIRSGDLVLLVVDLASASVLDDIEFIKGKLKEHKIELVKSAAEKIDADGFARIKTIMIGTHLDAAGAKDNLDALRELYGSELPFFSLSLITGEGTDKLPEEIFRTIDVVRIYTKSPGKPPDKSDPVVLRRGSTVFDFASDIHKDIAHNLKYARIWSKNKPDGLRVPRDYVFEDEDVCELHS